MYQERYHRTKFLVLRTAASCCYLNNLVYKIYSERISQSKQSSKLHAESLIETEHRISCCICFRYLFITFCASFFEEFK